MTISDTLTIPGYAVVDTFDFGGVQVTVSSTSTRWLELFRERYEPFVASRSELATKDCYQIVYQVRDSRVLSPEFLFAARQQPTHTQQLGSRMIVTGEAFQIELDRSLGIASISGPLATYPIDALIQILWYELFPDGLIFHAAALADNDRGWLMCGPSGAGKSTLASLFPEQALCDELAGVRLGPEPLVTALPFWTGHRGNRPLTAIYLIRHGQQNQRNELEPKQAFERLRQQVIWPEFDSEALERAFNTLFDLLERVQVWDLGFRPEPEVWSVISQDYVP